LLLKNEATEANFKKYASDYGILHFAMHAIINDEDPLASKLIFTLNGDSLEDGFLNTYEIYNLNLNADLAVLSACKTGVGKLSKGEGIMSLARGFLYAGVPGIVMTLWEVEDISSAIIMTDFYRNLKDGMAKDNALRESKLKYLNSADQLQSHPYFWAAFVQIGDNSPVYTKMYVGSRIYAIGIAAILFALGALILYRIIRRKKA
jgi:CHAT domain-containing protein